MRRKSIGVLAILALSLTVAMARSSANFHTHRQSPSDLEVSGSLAGLPTGSTRYITRDELLAMPQVSFTVSDDTNFSGLTKIQGVSLEELARQLGASGMSDLVVAICDDGYRANYPHSYLVAHHPVLVLNVDGHPPSGWPKDSQEHTYDMGPFMISHEHFTPSFKVLSHVDEAQIPWGVVRIEFRKEQIVFGAIAPRGAHARSPDVRAGFRIAQQNCFRCHNSGAEGGEKSGRSWQVIASLTTKSPDRFAKYIRNPLAVDPMAKMPANPDYDDATLNALTAYFRTFSEKTKP
jgi:mono/diheme cytochrome c family protein